MRALVAGGAGFVGSHLCRSFIHAGYEVVCVDDFSSGRRDNIRDLYGPGFRLVVGDVADHAFQAHLPDVDVICHLASPASPDDYDRNRMVTLAANGFGTWNLLSLAVRCGARFVFASTSEVYGDPLEHPQPETYRGNVDPTGPRSCYDEGKRFGEAAVAAFRHETGVQAAIVRIFNTYGPGMRRDDGRVVTEFIAAALDGRPLRVHGDGRQTRSFLFVDDLVDGLLRVALDPELDGRLVNIGHPEETTVEDLARLIAAVCASEAGLEYVAARPDDPGRRRPNIGRMQEVYGWHPTVSLEDGLARTIEWWPRGGADGVGCGRGG